MHDGFISYVRKGARKNAIVILTINVIFGALAFLYSLRSGEGIEQQAINVRRQVGILFLVPSLLAFICLLLQTRCTRGDKREQSTELVAPIVIFSLCFLILLINMGILIEEVDDVHRQQQLFIMWIIYFYNTNFMSVSYIPHLLTRLFLIACILSLVVYRSMVGDDLELVTGFAGGIFIAGI